MSRSNTSALVDFAFGALNLVVKKLDYKKLCSNLSDTLERMMLCVRLPVQDQLHFRRQRPT